MSTDRPARWVFASHGLANVDAFACMIAQDLGRLDASLVEADQAYVSLSDDEWESIEVNLAFNDHRILSYLWVLGAYELVRTLDQRCRHDSSLLSVELTQELTGLKHRIERLRIPLAKLEPARRFPDDSPIAYPARSRAHGIAWQVDHRVFVSRQELSDAVLDLLERGRASRDDA